MNKIFFKVVVIGTLLLVSQSYAHQVPYHGIDIVAHENNELGIDPELINQAFPNPIVAEKPSFIQRQLMRVGLPVYFALRASKNYIVHAWHKIRS